jgi:tRNA A-37 threonylcarbamoyl transferase component Bud32
MALDSDIKSMQPFIEDDTPTHAPIPARFTSLARTGWWIFTIISIGLFIFGLPYRFSDLLTARSGTQFALDQAGVSNLGWAVGLLIPEIILMLVFSSISISLFIQKSKSLNILIVSLVLISWGTTIMNVVDALAIEFPILETWILFSRAFSWSLVMTLLLIFPNGRLYPKWAKWLLAFWYIWIWSWFFFPELPHNIAIHGGLADPFRYTAYLLLLGIGLSTQVRRYRRVSSPNERQQAKWAFFGIGVMFIITFIEEAPSALNPALVDQNTAESIIYGLISTWTFVLGSLAFPFGIAASIQKKRLWKIDYVINRGLVYTLITVFLGLVFFIFYHLLRSLLTAITENQYILVVALTSLLISVSLFPPTRRTLQRLIDRHVYNIFIDYQPRLSRTSSRGFTLLEEKSQIGDYEIVEMIARGGMAEIFKGRHVTSGREAAVKILLEPFAQHEEFQKRFAHEAKAISQLDHPNIIKLIDYGETREMFYLIMEFVSYQTLATQIKSNAPLSLDYTREIIRQTAQGLDYAHQNGIIHRDIKPSNLLLRPPVGGKKVHQPVITDFGIAKIDGQSRWRQRRGFLGSFGYISPEQIQASDKVDQRTDIYSLGVITFQMLTGHLPFEAVSRAGTLIAHLQQPPPNILAYIPEIPDSIAFAIRKAMAKDPQDRFGRAEQFAEALSKQ